MTSETEQPKVPFGVDADWILEAFVSIANLDKDKSEPRWLVLFAGGTLVEGQLISVNEYLRAVGFPDELRKEHAQATLLEASVSPPRYIHLKNAKFYQAGGTAGPIPSTQGGLFRARLSSIDGFLLGRFSMEQS
jgi:hypothetical protein